MEEEEEPVPNPFPSPLVPLGKKATTHPALPLSLSLPPSSEIIRQFQVEEDENFFPLQARVKQRRRRPILSPHLSVVTSSAVMFRSVYATRLCMGERQSTQLPLGRDRGGGGGRNRRGRRRRRRRRRRRKEKGDLPTVIKWRRRVLTWKRRRCMKAQQHGRPIHRQAGRQRHCLTA